MRFFALNDEPNASPLQESDAISLREGQNKDKFKNLADMKRADMLREKTMGSKNVKLAQINAKIKPVLIEAKNESA